MWDKGAEYLKKIAGVVLIASILIWALGRFPEDISYSKDYGAEIKAVEERFGGSEAENLQPEKDILLRKLRTDKEHERLAASYIGMAGRAIEPVVAPLGFDWRMGISLLSGLAAKEIVVSTMGVLYHAGPESGNDSAGLADSIKGSRTASGRHIGPLEALSFMIFVLTYFPCFAAVAAIRRESGSWKWAAFSMTYTTVLAWLLAFAVYRAGLFLGL
jgi:ferrous iron transport protein B